MDVSPDDIHDAAEQFDIDLHDEPYLVWIMREVSDGETNLRSI